MPTTACNGIEIAYEITGDQGAVPLLLIMDFGAQLVVWDDEFCDQPANRGYCVIRFDNRDVGLSTKLDSAGVADIASAFADA